MNIKNAVKQWLTEKENKRYAELLREKQVSYGRWIVEQENARNSACVKVEQLPFVVLLASEGVFLYCGAGNILRYFMEHPQVQIMYGDEEVCVMPEDENGEPERGLPWFKPDWSPDVFRQYFYFGSVVAVRRDLLEAMAAKGMPMEAFAEKKEYNPFVKRVMEHKPLPEMYRVTDEAAYRQWMQMCVDMVGGYKRKCKAIGHIPEMWFSCESRAEQNKFRENWLMDMDSAEPVSRQAVTISVVIPSKDNPEILEKCIRACMDVTYMSEKGRLAKSVPGAEETKGSSRDIFLEVLVVDNGSNRENRQKIKNFISRLQNGENIKYLHYPMEFNFSVMCNLGAREAMGDFLLFLNDDVELSVPGSLQKMVSLAAQEHAGAVGLKLLYPGTDKIQHAGITNLPMGPVHKLQFMSDKDCYYYGANRGNRNVLAVTAACLMVETEKFKAAGGFAEELKVAFNDVDLCFRLYEMGYHNICINDVFAYHHESLSRGADESAEKLERLLAERDKLYLRHPQLEGVDPYYSIHLNRDGLDTSIRPAYLTSQNRTQEVVEPLMQCDVSGCRQDECLMVRVEDFREGHAVGYGVVLGDNNACYDKALCFEMIGDEGDLLQNSGIFALPLEGQYRPDLEENMPDQTNVALSGYDVKLSEGVLPKGIYRIGMTARNRVTGLKLINRTNRYVKI